MAPVALVWWRASTRSRGGGRDFDGGGGGSSNSSTSGTIYTASTTTGASGSSARESRPRDLHPFTEPVVEENAEELYADVAKELAEDKAKKLEHIKGLVDEFRADDRRASERWLSELDAGWVLHLAPGTHESSGSVVTSHGFQFLVERWNLALRKIGESILRSLGAWYSQRQRQDEDEGESKQLSPSEFAELVQATVLKMLPFVDIVAAAKTDEREGAPAEKLQKTCAAQKAWKVPDPRMRRKLRKAIVHRVIPAFIDSWEENSINAPQITPGEAEKMLGELFEG